MTKEGNTWRKKTVFSTNGAGTSTLKKKKNLDTDLTFFTKINSKCIIDLNVKCKTLKLLEDSIGETLDDLGYSDNFLDIISKVQSLKERIDKLNFMKINNFYSAKRQSGEWEDKFQTERKYLPKKTPYLIRGYYPKYTKNLIKLNKKANGPLKNWEKT